MEKELMVSVVMITYGHENYIKEAIEGVFKQECNFEIELIIANDCSPDNTDFIVNEYIKEHPKASIVKYFKHENNIGMMPNSIWALSQAKGKYIALCEGDDYWTDPLKLQKQVDFLEANSEYVMCFHKVNILKLGGNIVSDFLTKVPVNYQKREVLLKKGNYIHTPTVIFRNNLIDIPEIINQSPIGDFLLYALLTKFGKIGYLEQTMAVYRHNVGVLSKTKNNSFRNSLLMNLILLKIVDNKSDEKIIINRILDFVLLNYIKLPLNIFIKNLQNIPLRFFKNFFTKNNK